MDQLTPLLVAILSSGLLQAMKKIQAIPVNAGQTARLRTVLVVLVFAGNFLTAYLNGTLETFVASDYVQLGFVSAITWGLAHGVYKLSGAFAWVVRVVNKKKE